MLLETLDCMDKGMTMSETVEQVKLPEKYQDKDYLGEYYGTVEWSVKGIYCGYVGWFDGNAANLMPVSDREYQAVLRDLIGTEKLMEKIRTCIETEQYQLALQLLEIAGNEEAGGREQAACNAGKKQAEDREQAECRKLKKEALLGRARQMTSANARHYLIASAKNLG